MSEILNIIKTLFTWIINGIQDIFTIITSIPKYITVIRSYMNLIPSSILPYFIVMITAFVIIAIKRLVFN